MKRFRREIKGESLVVPSQSVSLREIMDRASKGLPINKRLSEHKPLPPDGENESDFEIGTREFHDLNDVYDLQQEIEQKVEEAKAKQKADEEEKAKSEFNKAVDAEISKREAEKVTQALNSAVN